LVQAPNLYQVLFWRPAAITYLMPLVLLTFLCALNFHLIRNDQLSLGFLIISGLLAFWVGAFSETAAVFQFGLLMELILWLRIKKPFGPHLQLSAVRYFKAAGVGSSLAILVLIAAPSAHLRQAALFPQPPWLLEMFRISVDGIHQFLLLTLYRQTIPTLLTFLTFFFAGFLFSHSSQKTFSLPRPRLWVHLLIATLGGFVLLLCIYLPSAYASSSPPEQRALLWARFTLVGVELLISMIMGDWMGRTFKRLTRRRSLVALGLFLALASILFIAFVPAKVAFQPAFPEIRNWLKQEPYRWGIVILLFLFSFWIVTHIKLEKSSMEEWVPLLLAVLILSMALFSLPGIFKAIPEYQLRAQLWDWRDARIRSAIQRGMYEIELPAVDSIADVAELQADANYWVNNCAERFYGMKSIRAVPPALTGIPPDE